MTDFDELKKIRSHIERMVTHLAREHGVMDKVVWKQMFVVSAEKFKTKKIEFI